MSSAWEGCQSTANWCEIIGFSFFNFLFLLADDCPYDLQDVQIQSNKRTYQVHIYVVVDFNCRYLKIGYKKSKSVAYLFNIYVFMLFYSFFLIFTEKIFSF